METNDATASSADAPLATEMQRCIDTCYECERICLHMATGHCLALGGRHALPEHLSTMLVCARMCGTAAAVMAMNSTLHRQVCAVCADMCDACITSCRDLDDMDACVEVCERCKTECEAMVDA